MKGVITFVIILIAAICILMTPSNIAYADSDIIASGTSGAEDDGRNLTWTLDADGLLTIDGEGTMYEYSSGRAPWYEYRQRITALSIKEGVTSLGSYAFYECSGLTSITIPEGITYIGQRAFYYCKGLTEIIYNARNVTSANHDIFLEAGTSVYGITVTIGDTVETNTCMLAL